MCTVMTSLPETQSRSCPLGCSSRPALASSSSSLTSSSRSEGSSAVACGYEVQMGPTCLDTAPEPGLDHEAQEVEGGGGDGETQEEDQGQQQAQPEAGGVVQGHSYCTGVCVEGKLVRQANF